MSCRGENTGSAKEPPAVRLKASKSMIDLLSQIVVRGSDQVELYRMRTWMKVNDDDANQMLRRSYRKPWEI